MNPNRRQAVLTGIAAIASYGRVQEFESTDAPNPICVFTKPFNSLTFDELAQQIAKVGFDGIEAPIRKGGHIEPEAAESELPKLVDALKKHHLKITVMASDINDPDDRMTEAVLRTASDLGIKRYRMKYLRYDLNQPIPKQLDRWKRRFQDLAAINRQFGLTAVYQNHASSRNLGAVIWDLREVLEGIPKNEIGVAYDIRHATVEGGQSWPISFHLIRPHIDTVYVKDFVWKHNKVKNVQLGTGQIDRNFFQMLAKSQFDGPISLHEEYLDHKRPELVPKHLQAMKNDLLVLKKWLVESKKHP